MASGSAPIEQQLFNFTLTGTSGTTSATRTGTPNVARYSEATSAGVGTNGTTNGFIRLGDAFDGLNTSIPTGLTAARIVEATRSATGEASAITQPFTAAGVSNAVRVIDAFTNNTNAAITGTVTYNNNLGSDGNTRYNVQGSGSRYLISNQYGVPLSSGEGPTDPTVTGVFGNTGATANPALTFANGSDAEVSSYTITVQPGQTVRLVTFAVVTGDVSRQGSRTDANSDGVPDEIVNDVQLGRTIAERITNGGNAIATNSPFFLGISQSELASIANFRFGPQSTPATVSFDNNLVGSDADDTIYLNFGDDTYRGGGGNDLVYGNQGDDLIYGNLDNDTLYGGQGDDRAFGNASNDVLFGNAGNDVVYGNQGADVVYGNQGQDTLFGGQDNDTLFGGQDADIVYGNLGADIVYGNQGADILYGGQGNDVLYGGQGNDTLAGGLGDDILRGGLGADRYVFGANSGRDLILGFNQQEGDRIALGGQTYTVSSAQNGDALLTLSGGGVVDLSGIRADQVNASYFAA